LNVRALVVIPAFNEAPNIAAVVQAVRARFDGEIAVIDDGSTDATAALAAAAGAIVLRHPCNLGIGASVQTGFLYGVAHDYDAVVRIDGDGQHDPSYINQFLAELASNQADVVVGSRFLGRRGFQSTFVRRMGILILTAVGALIGTRVTDPTSGFWAVNRRAMELLAHFQADDYPETQALVCATRSGYRIKEAPVIMHARMSGNSSIGALYSGFYMMKVLLALLIELLRRH
jgi:glycosyltransferase involved in cell wall biosynthesis